MNIANFLRTRQFERTPSNAWFCLTMHKVSVKDVTEETAHQLGSKVACQCNFIKKETLAQVFYCKFCEIFKNTFVTEHLRATASIF